MIRWICRRYLKQQMGKLGSLGVGVFRSCSLMMIHRWRAGILRSFCSSKLDGVMEEVDEREFLYEERLATILR